VITLLYSGMLAYRTYRVALQPLRFLLIFLFTVLVLICLKMT